VDADELEVSRGGKAREHLKYPLVGPVVAHVWKWETMMREQRREAKIVY